MKFDLKIPYSVEELAVKPIPRALRLVLEDVINNPKEYGKVELQGKEPFHVWIESKSLYLDFKEPMGTQKGLLRISAIRGAEKIFSVYPDQQTVEVLLEVFGEARNWVQDEIEKEREEATDYVESLITGLGKPVAKTVPRNAQGQIDFGAIVGEAPPPPAPRNRNNRNVFAAAAGQPQRAVLAEPQVVQGNPMNWAEMAAQANAEMALRMREERVRRDLEAGVLVGQRPEAEF